MKIYIVKRKKDGMLLEVSDRDIAQTMARQTFDGVNFHSEFELVGEATDVDKQSEELFQ